MKPLQEELAWCAGFFDGEGWIGINSVPSGKYLRMAVASTNEAMIKRFTAAVNCGRMSGPFNDKRPANNPVWYWRASSDEALEVTELLAPWLSEYSIKRIEAAKAKRYRRNMRPPKKRREMKNR